MTPPIEVFGYGRPFEASDIASLTDAATGAPAVATWSGCESEFVIPPGSGCVYSTSDYIEAWGQFSFAVESVAPGTYELFVGDTGALEGVPPRGVRDTFTVK